MRCTVSRAGNVEPWEQREGQCIAQSRQERGGIFRAAHRK